MTRYSALSLAAVALAALAACSGAPRGGPTASGTALGPPAAPAPDRSEPGTAGTYPYGKAPPAGGTPGEAGEAAEEGVIVHAPDGTVWVKPGTTSERYRADVDSCYAYARAQIAHDARMESDSGAAFPDSDDGFGLDALRGRMRDFERTNRRSALFSKCMEAKGYSRR